MPKRRTWQGRQEATAMREERERGSDLGRTGTWVRRSEARRSPRREQVHTSGRLPPSARLPGDTACTGPPNRGHGESGRPFPSWWPVPPRSTRQERQPARFDSNWTL